MVDLGSHLVVNIISNGGDWDNFFDITVFLILVVLHGELYHNHNFVVINFASIFEYYISFPFWVIS